MLPNNKLTFFLVFTVLLVVGLTFIATPAIAVNGTLSVPDADSLKADIQVNGIEGQPVTFELTITYDEVVTGFDVTDIELLATWDDSGTNRIITNGATAGAVTPTGDSTVFTSEITAKSNVEKVWIEVDAGAADTPGEVSQGGAQIAGDPTNALDQIIVEIVRRPPPTELTVSGDTTISGEGPFTVTLTSTTAITLTKADIAVTGGLIDSLSSDAAREVWTVTITPGVNKTEVIVEPAANGAYTFPTHTVTVDPTITDTELTVSGDTTISGEGPFTVTLTSTTAITLTKADIAVTGGLIDSLSSDTAKKVWTVTITPGVGKTEIIVEPAANSTYTFPTHTVTVDPTITDTELTVSGDTTISGEGPFTVTLTSTTAITLTKADIAVTGGLIDSLSSDTAKKVWTVTITPGVGKTEIIVEPAANSAYTFPTHTVTVDPTVTDTAIPLTMSEGTTIGPVSSFMIILRSAQGTPVTLTSADIKVTGGSVQTLTSDAAKEIWTVTIIRFVGQTQVTVEPADPTKFTFPSRTFTVDATGPMATITGTPPPAGGPFTITISFDEPLQAGATLAADEITVTDGTLSAFTAGTGTNDYTATITPDHGVTTVTVQVNANAVVDALGNQNVATPSPAHAFTVTATSVQTRTEPTLDVIFSEIANRTDDTNEWIEFKNRSGQPQDVDGWIVSIVTAVDSDVQLFKLPDVTIPDGGVLLVTDKDPVDQDSSLSSEAPLWKKVDMGALPNSGNFMLILRKSDDANQLGTANAIADIAGYYPSSSHGPTDLWPLHRYDAPLDKNNLSANKVYWRQHEDQVGTGGTENTDAGVAFQPIGFTGIGYQRDVDQTDENGGTPGYPNDIRKGTLSELTDDVTISEIMFANDGGRNDIQWIELYNSSKTDAVALDADDGWSLYIENYNDPNTTDEPLSGIINFKDNGNVKTILPNQTVLIVSSSRGGSSDSSHFPSNRVFGVFEEIPDEFGMINRRNPFLNPTVGFYIELVDGRNRPVDEVGNLDNRPRSAGEPVWELPNGRTADGYRTSIIRRYRDYNSRTRRYSNIGIVHDGTQREGWIRASETNFLYFERRTNTWYGLNSDYGTPGIRSGQVLPVQLSQFRPKLTEAGTVVIEWITESELDNAGFNILRGRTETGEFKIVNAQLIQGAGTTSERNTYTWIDTTAEPNVAYYYRIEDVSLAGERQTLAISRLKGLISAKGKLATQWAGLKKSRD